MLAASGVTRSKDQLDQNWSFRVEDAIVPMMPKSSHSELERNGGFFSKPQILFSTFLFPSSESQTWKGPRRSSSPTPMSPQSCVLPRGKPVLRGRGKTGERRKRKKINHWHFSTAFHVASSLRFLLSRVTITELKTPFLSPLLPAEGNSRVTAQIKCHSNNKKQWD